MFYLSYKQIAKLSKGVGLFIISTKEGLLTNHLCLKRKIGGACSLLFKLKMKNILKTKILIPADVSLFVKNSILFVKGSKLVIAELKNFLYLVKKIIC